MPPRASWTGTLKLSLIAIPVRLYRAVSASAGISLRMLHDNCYQRLHTQYVCPRHGAVEREDVVKGYEYEKDRFLVISDQTLEAIRLETRETIDVVQFVEAGEVDPLYLDTPYHMAPDGPLAGEGFRVLREAMRQEGRIAIGQVILGGREHVVVISPGEEGLCLTTLHYPPEICRDESIFAETSDREVDEEELGLARQLIRRRTAPFDPEKFHDRYEEAMREVIRGKIEGRKVEVVQAEKIGKVIDFMDALKCSIAATGQEKPEMKRKPPAASIEKAAGRRRKSGG